MKKIDFLQPNLIKADIEEATKVMKSGWLTAWNPVVAEFENKFAKYLGAKEAVVMSSGTAALHTSLLGLGIGKGDEVLTTPLSWVASTNAILYVGAKPVFIDIDSKTGLIDVDKIEKSINKKTKAILPVHLFGQMADMKKIYKIAQKYSLLVVEDACHAIESSRDGIRPGQLSNVACFSFHAAKNITSGEGGAIVTNDANLAKLVKSIADSGTEKGGGKRPMVRYGYKYSFTSFQAALLLSQLKRIRQINLGRKKVFGNYSSLFKKAQISNVSFVSDVPNSNHAYHIFAIRVPISSRDQLREKLAQKGIGTDVHFNPIHLEPFYKNKFGFKEGDYPNSENFGYSVISLPSFPAITKKTQKYIVDTIEKIMTA